MAVIDTYSVQYRTQHGWTTIYRSKYAAKVVAYRRKLGAGYRVNHVGVWS